MRESWRASACVAQFPWPSELPALPPMRRYVQPPRRVSAAEMRELLDACSEAMETLRRLRAFEAADRLRAAMRRLGRRVANKPLRELSRL